jgi:hypothetical protein
MRERELAADIRKILEAAQDGVDPVAVEDAVRRRDFAGLERALGLTAYSVVMDALIAVIRIHLLDIIEEEYNEEAEELGLPPMDENDPAIVGWITFKATEEATGIIRTSRETVAGVYGRNADGETSTADIAAAIIMSMWLMDKNAASVDAQRDRMREQGMNEAQVRRATMGTALVWFAYRISLIASVLHTAGKELGNATVWANVPYSLIINGVLETWRTARDEQVCKKCGPLDGVTILRGVETFPSGYPPLHPLCRCEIDRTPA